VGQRADDDDHGAARGVDDDDGAAREHDDNQPAGVVEYHHDDVRVPATIEYDDVDDVTRPVRLTESWW
jgi:hypothetical protein